MKKVFKTLSVVVLWFLLGTWYYRALCVLLLVLIWRREIQAKITNRWIWRACLAAPLLFCFLTMPIYRWNTDDRVRLIYQTSSYEPKLPPLYQYVANLLMPEEAAANLCIWGCRLMPANLVHDMYGGLSVNLLNQFKTDDKRGGIGKFSKPYSNLNWSGNYTMSGVTAQFFSEWMGQNERSVYVIRPKNFNPEKQYPVVFFMHGLLGNWQLYTGIFKELDDCIVMCVGTSDMSGCFRNKDIKDLFDHQIPFLERLGYNVDKQNLHLMGLSNGGTASNIACNCYSGKFKSITYISTNVSSDKYVHSKVLIIAGGKDHCAPGIEGIAKKMKRNGVDVHLLFKPEETHFMLVTSQDECIAFLKEHIHTL